MALGAAAHPPQGDGFLEIRLMTGELRCAAGTPAVATNELCAPIFQGGQDNSVFDVPIPDGADVSIVELRWTLASVFAGDLRMSLPVLYEEADQQHPEGSSILRAEITSNNAEGAPHGTTVNIRVGAPAQLALVLDQAFELAVSSFVDLGVPPGYSAFD